MGFNATALQVRRAYEAKYHKKAPENVPYSTLGRHMVDVMGEEAARFFVQAQSNDVDAAEPPIYRWAIAGDRKVLAFSPGDEGPTENWYAMDGDAVFRLIEEPGELMDWGDRVVDPRRAARLALVASSLLTFAKDELPDDLSHRGALRGV
jgi:hypothetical protein